MAYDKTKAVFVIDDENLDGTDWASPAWWRGNDSAVVGVVEIVNSWLDDEQGLYTRGGSYAYPPLTKLRDRIRFLMDSNESLRDRIYEMETEHTTTTLNLANQIHEMGDQAANRKKAWKNLVDRNEAQRIEIRELKELVEKYTRHTIANVLTENIVFVPLKVDDDQDKSAE